MSQKRTEAKEIKRKEIEQQLLELPIVQYAWLTEKDIPFSDHVREICRKECPRYGKSWSCPPGVGTVTECQERCSHFSEVFVFTTIAEVADIDNLEETLATRPEHEAVTKKVQEVLRPYFDRTLALSAQSCEICEKCAYRDVVRNGAAGRVIAGKAVFLIHTIKALKTSEL